MNNNFENRMTEDEIAERANEKAALAGLLGHLTGLAAIDSVEIGDPNLNRGVPFLAVRFAFLRSPYRLSISRDRSVEGGLDGIPQRG